MALANKCDRCGKLYERRTSLDKYSIKKIGPYSMTKDIDLCAVCQKELEKFMESGNCIERSETND